MAWFDSHCHLDAPEYDHDREAVVERALSAGVSRILVPAADPRDWQRVLACGRQFPGVVRVGLGVHPWSLPTLAPADLDEALGSLGSRLQDSGATVVGECGLDAGINKRGVPFEVQERVVRHHIELALALNRPIVLHSVKAHGRLAALLQPYRGLRGVMHSYSGPVELIDAFVNAGLAFSFAGAISWPTSKRPLLAAAAAPDDALLVESDGPDQALHGPQGRLPRSEPAHVVELGALLERLRGRPLRDNRAILDC